MLDRMDPSAIVQVNLTAATEKSQSLPTTPFVMKDLTLEEGAGDIKIESAEITILTTNPPLPKNLLDLIEARVERVAIKPKITVQTLPAELARHKEPTEQGPGVNSPGLTQSVVEPIRWIAFTLIGLTVTVFLLAWWISRGSKGITQTLERGINERRDSEPSSLQELPPKDNLPLTNSTSPSMARSGGTPFEEFPETALLALLTDCYWSAKDGYGAFIWNHISVVQKQKLLEQHVPFLEDYAKFLSQRVAEAVDLALEQDPAYLHPLAIFHLDNEGVTDLIKKHPGLLRSLSFLRVQSLKLGIAERIALGQKGSRDRSSGSTDLKRMAPSLPRVLPERLGLRLQNLEQEQELLDLPNLTFEVMSEVPSLGWLLRVPQETAAQILGEYSARDLASAWVAPEPVLRALGALLPDKKRQLLESYRTRLTPTRHGAVALAIHKRVLGVLEGAGSVSIDQAA